MTSKPVRAAEPGRVPLASQFAASAIAAVLPVTAVLVRAAPALLVPVAALLALAGALRARSPGDILSRCRAVAASREGLLLTVFTAWAGLSLFWAAAPATALVQYAKFVGLVVSGLGLVAFATHMFPARMAIWKGRTLGYETVVVLWFSVALAAAALLLGKEYALQASVGAHIEAALVRLSPPLIVLINYFWLAAAILLRRDRAWAAFLLLALLAAAVFASESQSAMVGLMVSLAVALAMRLAPRLATAALAGGLFAVFFAAPLLLGHAADILPRVLFDMLRHGNADIRAGIWAGDLALVRAVWPFGIGFDMSPLLPGSPLTQELALDWWTRLNAWHPHSTPVQVWMELGVVGAVLYATLIASVASRLTLLSSVNRPYVAAAIANMAVVAMVGYGAWESWWVAAQLGFAALAIGQAALTEPAAPA